MADYTSYEDALSILGWDTDDEVTDEDPVVSDEEDAEEEAYQKDVEASQTFVADGSELLDMDDAAEELTPAQKKIDKESSQFAHRPGDEWSVLLRSVLFSGLSEPIASAEVEKTLILAAKDGDQEAVVRLARAYAPALRGLTIARYGSRQFGHPSYKGSIAPSTDDLMSAATVALLTAIQQWDPEKVSRSPRLAGTLHSGSKARKEVDAILNLTRREKSFVVPSDTLARYLSYVHRAEDLYRERNEGRTPQSSRELLELVVEVSATDRTKKGRRLSEGTIRQTAGMLNSWNASFEDPVAGGPGDEGDPLVLADLMEDTSDLGNVEDTVEARMMADYNKALAGMALSLIEGDALLIVRYAYGFPPESYRSLSDRAIAEELKGTHGYSESKVRRIHKQALKVMRVGLGLPEEV